MFDDKDVTDVGARLHARFLALGDLTGRTSGEIIRAVGPPVSRSVLSGGNVLLQWQATGCHMALVFDANGQFVSISSEYANYAKYEPPRSQVPVRIAYALIALILLGVLVAWIEYKVRTGQ